MRRISLCVAAIALLAIALTPAAYAQPQERCFGETGFCVSGSILSYWERNGGIATFGAPISGVVLDTAYDSGSATWSGPVQWFERARLEIHDELGGRVLAGRIGADLHYSLQQTLVIPKPGREVAQAGCRYFPQTQQNLCEPYLGFWQRSGGAARLGLPLSAPHILTSGDWSGEVQWFERARLERHTELPDEPIMLGRLGSELRNDEPSAVCARQVYEPLRRSFLNPVFHRYMGCPQGPARALGAAEQYFERGVMVWVELATPSGALDRRIFVIRGVPLPLAYAVYYDPWSEGEPESAGLPPPPGLLEPRRGFGKVWRDFPEVREALGWATSPEVAHRATVQPFASAVDPHVGLIWFEDTDFFFAFGPGTQVTAFPRVGEPPP